MSECLKIPQFNLKLELRKSRGRNCLVHLQLTVKPNVIFFALARGTTAHTLNSWVYNIKENLRDVNVFQTCISSEKKLTLARIGLFGDYEGHDFTICLKYRAQVGV